MNLITKRVHMNRCNGREVKQLTLDRDFNVPDARPDALQIMKEQGEVQNELLVRNYHGPEARKSQERNLGKPCFY